MNTNSINNNGCSVCEAGQESYTTFRPAHRPKQTFYQYDYRHTGDGELFSTIAPTLEECRSRRDEWLRKKSKKYKLFVGLKKLGEFDSILEAKQYANNSGLVGAFNLVGDNYSDSWYISGTRHTVGEDHAYCLAQLRTLKQQQRRDNWLPTTKNRYEQGKRFTKEDMAYEIGRFEASHPAHIYWDKLKREDIVHSFNTLFGTTIN